MWSEVEGNRSPNHNLDIMHRPLAKHQIPKTRVTARWPQGSAFKYLQALLATLEFLTNPQDHSGSQGAQAPGLGQKDE